MLVSSLALLSMLGCQYGLSLPSTEEGFAGKRKPGLKFKLRERRPILPGFHSGPPPPEPGIVKEQCDDLDHGGPLAKGCLSGHIECGETIIGHTLGGVKRFDTKFYEQNFCTPATTQHDGGDERIYRLEMPDGPYKAFVTLDSPCADLDLAGIRWNDETCPTKKSMVNRCEMWPDNHGKREVIELVTDRGGAWLLVVEGKGNDEGAFSLTVQCRPGLQ